MYMCCLSLYFLLIIKYKWALQRLQKIEPYMHVCCITFPLVASILGWISEFYNPFIVGCGVQSYPIRCGTSNGVHCLRGENVEIYRWILITIPMIVAFFFISLAMILVYVSVRMRERSISRFQRTSDTSETSSYDRFSEDFRRAWQFSGVFIFVTIPLVVPVFAPAPKKPFIMALMRAIIAPMQGFFNAIVFSRDMEGELIRSIWDSVYRSRIRNVPRSDTPQLTIEAGLGE